jgi:hypothetical protein
MTASIELAEDLAAFLDTLLPGDDVFPAASATIAPDLFVRRWSTGEVVALPALLARLSRKRAFKALSEEERKAAARKLETEDGTLFVFVCRLAYLCYYQCPEVVMAIRALGHDYNLAPQPDGYAPLPRDPVYDSPRHSRGRYVGTAAAARVDLSVLPSFNAQPPACA